jgi:benzoate membrane transport protein
LKRGLWIVPISAGFVAVLVGFSSSVAIVLQAAQAAGTTPAQAASWIFALSIAMGVSSMGLSWWSRMPVLTAWSTPGAALLVTSLPGVPLAEAIGAFMVCGVMITAIGLSGAFEAWVGRLPIGIAAAMLAGVLLRFGIDIAEGAKLDPLLVIGMALAFFLGKRWLSRYAVPLTLLVGLGLAAGFGQLDFSRLQWALTVPQWVSPQFSWSAVVGIAVPLFVVTMASQNLPGLAVLRASGYEPRVSPIITTTGVVTILGAPFGGFAINLAAITAALCASTEGHPDPAQRYKASFAAGAFYLVAGLFGASVVALFAAMPKALVMAIAGLALLGTIANALESALKQIDQRDAALVCFLVSASGVSFFGVGAAFWGLLAGLLVLGLLKRETPFR